MFKIILLKNVSKFLKKHSGENIIVQFRNKIDVLSKNPSSDKLDIKKLIGEQDKYRLRIGKFRFLYHINNKTIIITVYKADGRGGIYK